MFDIVSIKQISLIKTGLHFEYIDDTNEYCYIHVNNEQSEEVLGRNLPECHGSDIDVLHRDLVQYLQEKVLKGYAIREYRDEDGELINKCQQLFLEIDEDGNKDELKNILSMARVFDIKHVILFGNVFLHPNIDEILIFIKNNGIFCTVWSQCDGYNKIKIGVLSKIDNIIIDGRQMSRSILHKITQHYYTNNINFDIMGNESIRDLIDKYNYNIKQYAEENIFTDNYMQILASGDVNVVQECDEVQDDINKKTIAQIWLDHT